MYAFDSMSMCGFDKDAKHQSYEEFTFDIDVDSTGVVIGFGIECCADAFDPLLGFLGGFVFDCDVDGVKVDHFL